MLKSIFLLGILSVAVSQPALGQVPVQANTNHELMLASTDQRLAFNKRLVYDFWREVLEGGHLELVEKYLAKTYIQHNPNVPTGRSGFVEFFSKFSKARPISERITSPLVAILAEGDLVTLSFVNQLPDPKGGSKSYTTTSFDLFRVQEGKIVEHWDSATKQ